MRARTALLCIVLLSSCLPTDPNGEPSTEEASQGASPALTTISAAATVEVPIPIGPPPPMQRYPEVWTSNSSVTWPSDANRLQVIIRRGHSSPFATAGTFYAFIISDGNRLRRALVIPTSEYSSFVAHLHLVFTVAETPGSSRSHSIAGGLYVGPQPAGPPGDPFPLTYLDRILAAAASIDQSARAAVEYPL